MARAKRTVVTFATVRKFALALPDAQESTSYGTPAFKVRGKLFARLHDSGESLVVKVDLDEREILLRADPKSFHITDHYLRYPYMLVRLAAVSEAALRERLEESWRRSAPKRLVAAFDAA